ncbi:translocation/assembly module TamB domain-containing protein [Acaryochloris thomasi]|uniref:translocation/assembly module TamB domain-containing protein n=1 Tax=Acaryochloris thomasi TaxID=2929456 RepID=UPI001F39B89A|nr:translocation/assembly module TamB domain-containing protein [Acaryochloris thomasi]
MLSLLLLGIGGGLWWGDRFVKQELAPTIAKDLSKSLNRPVNVGDVTGYSLTGIAIGPSSIPPHEQTLNGRTTLDRDSVEIDAVKANFNLWKTLWTRTIDLDITVINPRLYLDQNQEGQWLTTQLTPPQDSKSWLKTEIKTVRLRQGQIKVQPWGKAARQLNPLNGTLALANKNQTLRLNATGTLDSGGQATLKADWQQPEQTLKLWASLKDLDVPPLLDLAPTLPITIKSGRVSGNLEARYQPEQPLTLAYKGQIEAADTTVTSENIRVQARRLQTDLQVQYRPKVLPKITGDVQAQDANVWVPEDLFLDNNRQQRQNLRRVNGTLKFLGTPRQQVQFDLRGNLASGGRLRTKGAALIALKDQRSLIWPQLNLLVQGRNLSANILDQAYNLPVRLRQGQANVNLLVKLTRGSQPNLQGTATLNNVAGQIEGLPQPFSQANGRLRLRGLTTRFENTTALYGKIPIQGGGWIDPKRGFNLMGRTAVMETNLALSELGLTKLPFPVQGKVQARNIRVTGALSDPVLTGDMVAPGTTILDEVPFNRLTAQFRLQAPNLTIGNIVGTPTPGGQITGAVGYNLRPGGQIKGLLQAQNIPGDAVARFYNADPGFAIGPVQGPIILSGPAEEVETKVEFQALEGEFPTQGQVIIRNQLARLQNVVTQLPGGNLNINGLIDIPRDRVQANVEIPGLSLPAYDPTLRGQMTGQFALTAPFSTFSLNNAQGVGRLRFSEGINLVEDPINAQVGWNGQQLLVQRATAPNFLASGQIGVNLDGPEGLQLTTLALNVQAQKYDLSRLQAQGITPVPLTGRADLDGRLTGTVAAPNLFATLRVNQLAVTRLAFEPLSGPIRYRAEQGLDLRLKGTRDRISLALGPDQLPRSFDIKRDQAIALGRSQGNDLRVTLRQFPLEVLNLQAANNLGTVSGLASGDFTANVRAAALQGQFAIDRPGIGKLLGKSFAGSLRYAKGVASVTDADLIYRDSRYRLTASVAPGNNFETSGEIEVLRGQLADLVPAWQILTLDNKLTALGSAADVTTVPVGLPNAPLFTQLQRLTEIEQLIAKEKEQQEEASPFPPLEDLEGQLVGQIQFQGSTARGFQGDFDLKSGYIEWQPYSLDQIVVQGQWQDTAFTFDTLQAASGDSIAKFEGQVGGERQGGKLTFANVPIEPLNQFLELPFQVSGSLEGAATLAGTLADPQVRGRFSVTEAALDRTPVQQAQADLNYSRGRLQFDGSANVSSPEPITLTGNIPYQLPFATVAPESDQLNVRLAVRDQGLSVLNLFTDQVAWREGQGNLNVVAQGTVARPQVTGSLQVNNAIIAAQALDEPLTNVSGDIRFERDRIAIAKNLSGRYSQGILRASGSLPLYASSSTDQLQVSLRNLDLSLKGLYRGQIGGNLIVTGTAFKPQLGGGITLSKGQVILPETSPQGTVGSSPDTVENAMPLRFKDLKVTVTDTVRVAQPPLLSFSAAGDVILNGSIDNLSPEGVLNFRRGTVNLFTSRFRLDRRRENFAQFTPQFGLDPYLSLGMVTTVTDGVASRLSTLNEGSALQTNPVGNIESVRVRASVEGRASELTRNFDRVLELDSTPSRTEGEIFALLGGGVTESLEEGDTQLALVNLASTAALTGVEGLFDDVLGSRGSFRVFPVLIPNEDDRNRSTLEFGAEVGYDLTNSFSASVLQIISDLDEPTLFNLSYEINDQLRIRSAVSTDGEAFGILEYRIRF